MNYKRVTKSFGGVTATAVALGTKKQVVDRWRARGGIPPKWQLKIARLKPQFRPDKKARELAETVGLSIG